MFGLGPISPLQIMKADAVVAEANRGVDRREGGALTHAELVVLAGPVKRAKEFLETQAKGPVEKKIDSIKDLFARINIIKSAAGRTRHLARPGCA